MTLTIIELTLSTATFGLGLLADVAQSAALLSLKSSLSLCATSLELIVSILYWGAQGLVAGFALRRGIWSRSFRTSRSTWCSSLFLLLYLFLLSPPWAIRAREAMAIGTAMTLAYWAWLEYCFYYNGWVGSRVYPLL